VTNAAGENINLRAGAGISYRVVDVLDNNDTLQVYGQSDDGAWLRSNRGWISSSVATLGDCGGETLPTFASNADTYTQSMSAFTLQVNDAAQCEATPPGMLIQVPDGQTANIMVNNVELRIGSTAFVTIVDDEDENDDEDDSLMVANLDGDIYATGNGTTQHLFPGSQSSTPLDSNGMPSGSPQGIVPIGEPVNMLSDNLLSTTLPNGVPIPEPLSSTPPTSDDGSGTTGVTVPLGEWGACGSCSTCVGPTDQCIVDPSGACVWDAAGCGGIGLEPGVSCTAFCGGSASFTMGTGSSFDIIYSSGDGAILSGVSPNSGGLSGVSAYEEQGSDTRTTIFFTCDVPTSSGTFSVDIYDSEGRFFQVGFTLTCT
jgi:hypothetical protein